jgi:hypothetical protein
MTPPGAERSVVDTAKVRDYLLSDSHPVGRFKSAFFVSLGYSGTRWEALAADLRSHLLSNDAVATELSVYGQKYEIRGSLEGPSGKSAVLVSVWIVLRTEDFPRFVTAFPGTKP